MSTTPPFGLWPSPITPRSLAASLRLSDVQWDSNGRRLVWLEGRGAQGVLVVADADGQSAPRDLSPAELSVRAKVGYGGGDFCVARGHAYFADGGSGRLYRVALDGGPASPITPAFGYAAAPALSPDGRHLLYVHSYEDVDSLAIVDAEGRHWPQRLIDGHDFFMQPCWHPAGDRIAYVAWDHPNMPWDGTTLYLATLDAGSPLPTLRANLEVAGGPETAIFQPAFSPDGRYLAYVSDESGWGQIMLYDLADGSYRQLTEGEAEHGQPAWVQGMRSLAWSRDSRRLYFLRNEGGVGRVLVQPIDGGAAQLLSEGEGYTWFEQPAASPGADALAGIASSSATPSRIVLADAARTRVLRRSSAEAVPPAQLAPARPVRWASAGGATAHGMLYLPQGFTPGQAGPRPPAIVRIHGGPTDQATAEYSGQVQFFTTRGYTVLDINYRGSTGYGRAYMLALRGQWGVCDVEDAASGARYLAESGAAEASQIVIMGGSAGGFTVLEALCRAPGLFRAGLCLYGVTNMFTLAADTHKFEARYLDQLLGPLPEAAAIYRERSPIFHAGLIRDPVAIFQGADDQVVPQAQAESIVAALRRSGVPHEYHLYAGEGHGWRRPETIEAFYRAVEAFLRQYVIFA